MTIPRRLSIAIVLVSMAAACKAPVPRAPEPAAPAPSAQDRGMPFEATAYSIEGKTATGTQTRQGMVAADPKVLPLGTRIRVHDAGPYSGEYLVRDTGRTVKGREIDLYLADDREAKRFGRKNVRVEILQYGDGRPLKPNR